jgi:hypothetical protein
VSREQLLSRLVNLGFNLDALKTLNNKSLAIMLACHTQK